MSDAPKKSDDTPTGINPGSDAGDDRPPTVGNNGRAKGNGKTPQGDKPPRHRQIMPAGWFLGLMAVLTLMLLLNGGGDDADTISYSFFREQLAAGNVESVVLSGDTMTGKFKEAPLAPPVEEEGESEESNESKDDATGNEGGEPETEDAADGKEPKTLSEDFSVQLPRSGVSEDLEKALVDSGVTWENRQPVDWGGILTLVWFGLLVGMIILMFSFFRRTRDQVMGGGMLGGVTKSPARLYDAENQTKITFDDVAGLKGVKADLIEIVEFLREPEKFHKLGARVPKGVLLNGPPGTGKTLLAKAVAGEAGVPFFSINGSEFIQLFVGVGASRVRDMFQTAKKNAPAILFIDEIDAVGRQRGAGLGGGHDEREQTLNQILSEMDGFTQSETVIVIAATNRPDVLDPALLRPGRFDRHVTVGRPSIEGRRQLFEVHTREVPIGDDVDFDSLARGTVGLTGADVANLVNEAALWATRQDRKFVTMEDFEYARDKILMGATRDEALTDQEKEMTAYHEAGHALAAWLLPGCDRLHKVTIIPRGRALGVTQLAPDEDRHSQSRTQLNANLAMALGGRAAELIAFDELSNGAGSDLERATEIARKMVTHWGMSERLGPVAYHGGGDNPFLGREIVQEQKPYSDETAKLIDEETARILHEASDRVSKLLKENRDKLDKMVEALLEREEIDEHEVEDLIGPSVHGDRPEKSIVVAPPTPTPLGK